MINDNRWDMTVGEGILLILPVCTVLTAFHTVIYAQVHMNVLLFLLINKVKLMIFFVRVQIH